MLRADTCIGTAFGLDFFLLPRGFTDDLRTTTRIFLPLVDFFLLEGGSEYLASGYSSTLVAVFYCSMPRRTLPTKPCLTT